MQDPSGNVVRARVGSAQRSGIAGQLLGDWRFVTVVLVLVVAAAGLNASVQYLKLHFRKMPVPMREQFGDAMPVIMGNWVQAARDDTLEPDIVISLAAENYLFCSYVNAAAVGKTPQQLRKELVEGRTVMEQKEAVYRLSMTHPGSVVHVGLTYYTGKADTVAHVAERCYVGGGFEPVNAATEEWGLDRDLRVRTIVFQNQVNPSDVQTVMYVFHANGHYEPDSLRVRLLLQDLFQRYGYYAKIELSCPTRDRDVAVRSLKNLLGESLPHVEKALPDWEQYRSRK